MIKNGIVIEFHTRILKSHDIFGLFLITIEDNIGDLVVRVFLKIARAGIF
jgi:hypothetical protein